MLWTLATFETVVLCLLQGTHVKPTAPKEDKPAPCVCDPPVVVFKDFGVGQIYKKVVKITNASSHRTSFRLLEVPAEHATVLDAQQENFGFIPAGMATKVTVTFKPEADRDLRTELDVLTDKGVCKIPVDCMCKKAVLSVCSTVLDMGSVTLGQSTKQQIMLKNAGALEV